MPSSRIHAVLLAVHYGTERWSDCSTSDVTSQLTTPRLHSGAGLLPLALNDAQCARLLARLREDGLIDRVPAIGRSGTRWVMTDEGRARAEGLIEAWERAAVS